MKEKILLLIFLITFSSCQKAKTKIVDDQLSIVPIPKNIILDSKKRGLVLTNSILFFTSSPEINSLVSIFEKDIESISSVDINLKETPKTKANLIFEIDNNLKNEEYSIRISDNILINVGSYDALAMARRLIHHLL